MSQELMLYSSLSEKVDLPTLPTDLLDYIEDVILNNKYPKEMPREIDLGELDDMLNRVLALSEADPYHSEYGSVLLYNKKLKSFSMTNPQKGNASSAELTFPASKTLACILHPHQNDSPFSNTDVSLLFPSLNIQTPPPATLLITPTRKLLLVKTKDNYLEEAIRPEFWESREQMMFRLTRFAQNNDLKIYSAPRHKRILSLAN